MPNLTAYLVLFSWPLVTVVLFRVLTPERALVWTILGAYLFLPVRPVIDFPMIPAIDKSVMASLMALIAVLLLRKGWGTAKVPAIAGAASVGGTDFVRRNENVALRRESSGVQVGQSPIEAISGRSRKTQPQDRLLSKGWLIAIVLAAFLGVFATTLTNAEAVPAGPFFLPGMRAYDLVSIGLSLGITLIPFVLGWLFLGSPAGRRTLLVAFAVGGLLYAPLVLIEVRLSPQLNTWIYGFFPHSFAQHFRNGGFRPIVFLPHGLWVGIFLTLAILSSLALWRLTPTGLKPFLRLRWLFLAAGLLVVLVLAKSLGALLIAMVLGAVVLFGGQRLVVLVAATVAVVVLVYPMARGMGLVPVEAVENFAKNISPARAQSLEFRLQNEDVLLAKANEKALFGWGTWGRGFIYDDWGNRTSVTDGAWIIVMNGFGWIGYLAQFGLLCIPMIRLAFRRGLGAEEAFVAAVLAANLLDLIPNATLEPITWLAAGALAGTVLPQGINEARAVSRRQAVHVRRDLREADQTQPIRRV
ncbi:hypothetical protein [Fuscovulum ytuae]|uniref:O-antigen ligase domain-containing protein n=1 Tax=Fuscovulum ytuae TaxID=3042299 RepID=A0ABY8Q769_9RHOB|nr:hypothetical protein [Fuscovulum sp. YMD61]WGV15936.1 hypothetical protein QF092_17045 [Fuscovulum sp. YMD61]